ncbi:hypothetical protein ACFLXV_00695 [Chloroflexota bacterium]
MTNELLGYWVEGNVLTDPAGDTLIGSLAVVVERVLYIFASILSIA